MKVESLKNEILNKYQVLQSKLTNEEKIAVHFKSLGNFIYHIFSVDYLSTQPSKLKEINLYEAQKQVLAYIDLILASEVSVEDSEILFKKYINVIGTYMSKNFGFIFAGGKIRYFFVFTNIVVGLAVDLVISFVFDEVIWVFTAFFVIYAVFKIAVKQKNKKIYGPNY